MQLKMIKVRLPMALPTATAARQHLYIHGQLRQTNLTGQPYVQTRAVKVNINYRLALADHKGLLVQSLTQPPKAAQKRCLTQI